MTWKKYIVFLVLLCLFCCSPPLVFSQSTTDGLGESWQTFDQIIQSLQSEIEALKSELLIMQDSHNLSTTKLQSWIKSLGEQVAQREADLADYKRRLTLSEAGAQATASLNKQLSKDLRQARVTNGILIGVATGLGIGLVYALTH
jgi:chromosome segregation ATPase